MIKQSVKNFFKNLKYFFTPLGTIALGCVIGLSIAVPGIVSALSDAADGVRDALENADVDFTKLWDYLVEAVSALDWSDPVEALGQMFGEEWLSAALKACVDALVENSEAYAQPLNAVVTAFLDKAVVYAVVLALFVLLGVIGGFYLTKCLIRREIAKRAFWKFFLVSILDAVLTATLVALCLWLLTLWKASIFVSSVVSWLLFGFVALTEAYVVHAYKKVPFKDIVNIKNILKLIASDAIIFAVTAAAVALITLAINAAVGIFVGIALIEIAFIVMSLNAEAYVKSVAQSKTDLPQTPLSDDGKTAAEPPADALSEAAASADAQKSLDN